MDHETGIFTCPLGGTYMFVFHIATHDNKKALLSIRLNGEEVASVFDQNHKVNNYNKQNDIKTPKYKEISKDQTNDCIIILYRITTKTQWLEPPFLSISNEEMK